MGFTRHIPILVSLVILGCALVLPAPAQIVAPATVDAADDIRAYLPMAWRETPTNAFGVAMYGAVDSANGLNAMGEAGARWVTAGLDWRVVEPREGVFNWSSYDQAFSNAHVAGMRVFVLFYGDPEWAWTPDRKNTVPEKRLAFVRLMAERYDCDGLNDAPGTACVDAWSFYPEPDGYRPWLTETPGAKGFWGRRGADYADMLAGVSQAIHSQSPRAKVLIGGVAYDYFENQGGWFVRSFLDDVLGRLTSQHGGAAKTIDAFAFHYYPIAYRSIRDKASAIRSILDRYGVGGLPLYVPESGYWSSTRRGSDETKQAIWLAQQYARAIAEGIVQVSWLGVFDNGPGTEEHGLFRGRDLTQPKQAYFAYRTAVRFLGDATYLGRIPGTVIEGYLFRTQANRLLAALWPQHSAGTATLDAGCLNRFDHLGKFIATMRDGDSLWDSDRAQNGRISFSVKPGEVLYVESC